MSSFRPLLACLWLAVLAAVGAAPARAEEPATPVAPVSVPAADAPRASAQYKVGAGDTLQILIYGEPGLSGAFPVSDNGDLDFPLLGSVSVQGLTTAEITELLRSRLTPGYLLNPNVTVWLAAYRSQPVQVLGDVAKPGVYFLRGPTTVLQILSEAGGVSRSGVNEVRVTRGGQDGRVTVLPYDKLLTHQAEDMTLEPSDIVYVPQGLVSVMGQVARPGEVPFRDGLTISQCIAAAGGGLPIADLSHVYILRGEQRTRVNVRKVLAGKAEDVPVQPGDRIFVRESAL